jgi:tetratricopeptide (TPR) repeat protein
MANEDKLTDVARYVEGDMEAGERQAFEALLREDAELQGLLTEYKDIHQTLKMKIAPDARDKAVENTLTELNGKYFRKEGKTIALNGYLKWISIAAVLVIGLLVWAPWSAGLYEKYAISREMSVAERGTGAEQKIEDAATLYNTGDFSGAAKILASVYQSNPERAMVAYYYGISLIENNQDQEARKVLLKLYEGSSVFKYDALYNIGLSYVKEKNDKEALVWLSKIPAEDNNYGQAKELIGKLK